MTAVVVVLLRGWPFAPRCSLPIDTTIHIEDRLPPLVLYFFALLICFLCAPFSLFLICVGNRDIADTLDHENLSSRIWSNVEKNVSRCLL